MNICTTQSCTLIQCNFIGNQAAGVGGVIEATDSGKKPTVIFTVSAGKEGQYKFENNYAGENGGAIRANWVTSFTVTGYVFSGNNCGGSGKVISTGDNPNVKVTLNQCTALSGADIHTETNAGAVVQNDSLQ